MSAKDSFNIHASIWINSGFDEERGEEERLRQLTRNHQCCKGADRISKVALVSRYSSGLPGAMVSGAWAPCIGARTHPPSAEQLDPRHHRTNDRKLDVVIPLVTALERPRDTHATMAAFTRHASFGLVVGRLRQRA